MLFKVIDAQLEGRKKGCGHLMGEGSRGLGGDVLEEEVGWAEEAGGAADVGKGMASGNTVSLRSPSHRDCNHMTTQYHNHYRVLSKPPPQLLS